MVLYIMMIWEIAIKWIGVVFYIMIGHNGLLCNIGIGTEIIIV